MGAKFRKRVASDGSTSWHTIIDAGADPMSGKRRQRRLTAPTKDALTKLVTKTLATVHQGAYIDLSDDRLETYLQHWLAAIEPTVRPATASRYGDMIRRHLAPGLGTVPLARLSPERLQRFYADRLAAGLSSTTVRNLHMLLHRALDQAVKWRKLAINPCDAAQAPRRARPEMTTWTPEQVRHFLTATAAEELHALFRLALLTGMRRGELLALIWDDVDLDRAALAVRRSLTIDRDRHWIIGEPKTAAGRRAVALPASCVAALRRHRVRQTARRLSIGDLWQPTGLVFDRGDGTLLHPNVALATFGRLTKAAGLPHIRFHDLRHTSATLALADGVHPKIVSERLGHSSVAMTLDRYSHVSLNMQRDAADRLDRLAGGA